MNNRIDAKNLALPLFLRMPMLLDSNGLIEV